MNRYISDTHFGHFNIIGYDGRPFSTKEEMDEQMIKMWNDVVSDDDTVYILGDFSWHKEAETIKILKALKGDKVLIKGNHDRVSPNISKCFIKVCDYLEVRDGTEKVVMSHFPIMFWNGHMRNSIHLYGHVHNAVEWEWCKSWHKEYQATQINPAKVYNVGCMMKYINYAPRTLQEIIDGNADN